MLPEPQHRHRQKTGDGQPSPPPDARRRLPAERAGDRGQRRTLNQARAVGQLRATGRSTVERPPPLNGHVKEKKGGRLLRLKGLLKGDGFSLADEATEKHKRVIAMEVRTGTLGGGGTGGTGHTGGPLGRLVRSELSAWEIVTAITPEATRFLCVFFYICVSFYNSKAFRGPGPDVGLGGASKSPGTQWTPGSDRDSRAVRTVAP